MERKYVEPDDIEPKSLEDTWKAFLKGKDIAYTSIQAWSEECIDSESEQRSYEWSMRRLLLRERGRYIFQLQSGGMGSTPKPIVPGSQLCFVPGSRWLHILNPDSTRYVSAAVLHGAMGDHLARYASLEQRDRRWEMVQLQ